MNEEVHVVLDANHRKAMGELKREGHIWGDWFPHGKFKKYRVCVVGDCSEVQIETVK